MDNISLIGTIGTLIFGLLSVYLFFKSKRTKSILFISENYVLQTKNHPSLRLSFGDTEISNLSKATIVFFNSGTDAIKKSDVPKLMVVLDKRVKLLSSNLTVVSSPDNKIAAVACENRIALDLEFLNPRDGAVMEVLYESQNDADSPGNSPELSFDGTIIGGRISTRPYGEISGWPQKRDVMFDGVVACLALSNGLAFIYLGCFQPGWMPLLPGISLGVAFVSFFWLLVGLYRLTRRRMLRLPEWIPSDLR